MLWVAPPPTCSLFGCSNDSPFALQAEVARVPPPPFIHQRGSRPVLLMRTVTAPLAEP